MACRLRSRLRSRHERRKRSAGLRLVHSSLYGSCSRWVFGFTVSRRRDIRMTILPPARLARKKHLPSRTPPGLSCLVPSGRGIRPPPRLIDVARQAGVSRATAAQVLNASGGQSVRVSEATRKRVLAVARAVDYRPNRVAQQLKGGRSRLLGVLLDSVNMEVMSNRLAALERRARQQGYRLTIGQVHQDPGAV